MSIGSEKNEALMKAGGSCLACTFCTNFHCRAAVGQRRIELIGAELCFEVYYNVYTNVYMSCVYLRINIYIHIHRCK